MVEEFKDGYYYRVIPKKANELVSCLVYELQCLRDGKYRKFNADKSVSKYNYGYLSGCECQDSENKCYNVFPHSNKEYFEEMPFAPGDRVCSARLNNGVIYKILSFNTEIDPDKALCRDFGGEEIYIRIEDLKLYEECKIPDSKYGRTMLNDTIDAFGYAIHSKPYKLKVLLDADIKNLRIRFKVLEQDEDLRGKGDLFRGIDLDIKSFTRVRLTDDKIYIRGGDRDKDNNYSEYIHFDLEREFEEYKNNFVRTIQNFGGVVEHEQLGAFHVKLSVDNIQYFNNLKTWVMKPIILDEAQFLKKKYSKPKIRIDKPERIEIKPVRRRVNIKEE